jgi:two-component system NtrC family sensor kinase
MMDGRIMKLGLRVKLVVSFLAVIAITGITATVIGMHLIGSGIVREAQDKVSLDLNSARQIYDQKLKDVEEVVAFSAVRRFAVLEAFKQRNREVLLQGLREAVLKTHLDILTITDEKGVVVLRAANPEVFGDSQASDELLSKVLRDRRIYSATEIVPREELVKESPELAEKAAFEIIPTPMAKPTTEKISTSGMMLKSAVPINDDSGEMIGILYGGVLLNRDFEIVDKTKDIVYQGVKYEGKDIGTATIFQKDLRISTNVKNKDGSRAVGTRVSAEVYDRVVGEGNTWKARAFVVNDWYLTAYEPIRNVDDEVIGILYVGVLEKKYNDLKNATFWTFAGVAIAGMALALIVGYFLANTVVKPVLSLRKGFDHIEEGDFDHEVRVKAADEVGSLTESYNRVRRELKETYRKLQGKIEAADEDLRKAYDELRRKQEQLIHAEKLASLGSMAAGVAHEINNPLGTITLYAQMSLDQLPEGDTDNRENLEIIVKHATRAAKIVRDLLEFARRGELEVQPLDINTIMRNVLSMTTHQAELQQVSVVEHLEENLPRVIGDPGKLQQVFVNMVMNAIQAMSAGGQLTVTTGSPDAGTVLIEIRDTGCGIPDENLKRIFDPFFTTKATGKGTGLGLSVSHGIVQQHKGSISVSSRVGEGTAFTIALPTSGKEGQK